MPWKGSEGTKVSLEFSFKTCAFTVRALGNAVKGIILFVNVSRFGSENDDAFCYRLREFKEFNSTQQTKGMKASRTPLDRAHSQAVLRLALQGGWGGASR